MRGAFLTALPASTVCLAQTDDAREMLVRYLNDVGTRQVRADAEQRKRDVRSKLSNLIGGIPEPAKQVEVRQFGVLQGDGFRVEKIAYSRCIAICSSIEFRRHSR